jgi:hypothetical protein
MYHPSMSGGAAKMAEIRGGRCKIRTCDPLGVKDSGSRKSRLFSATSQGVFTLWRGLVPAAFYPVPGIVPAEPLGDLA